MLLVEELQNDASFWCIFMWNTSGVHLSKSKKCKLCQDSHDLDECKEFRMRSMDDKRKFIMKSHLCFGCYGTNHISKNCMNKRTCAICGKPHPTAMHMDNFRVKDFVRPKTIPVQSSTDHRSTEQNCVDSTDNVILQPIIPVIARQSTDGKPVRTYAMIDSGSSACFLTDELKEELEALSENTTVQINTINGTDDITTAKVSDIYITDCSDGNSVALPTAYVRDIPTQREHIPKPEFIKDVAHFSDVHIPPYMPNVDVGLVIGVNCPVASQPLKVIPGEDPDGLYAVMYKHGWSLNGQLKSVRDQT